MNTSPEDKLLHYLLDPLAGEARAPQPDLAETEAARAELEELLFGTENVPAEDEPSPTDDSPEMPCPPP